MEKGSTVGLARRLIMCRYDRVMSLIAFKWIPKTDWVHYVDDELQFLEYNFEAGGVFNVVVTRVQKRLKLGGKVVLEAPDHEAVGLQVISYASVKSK